MTGKINGNSNSIRGKIGALTGYVRNGKHYFRCSETAKDKSHSPKQLKQRSKFKVATQAFSRLSPAFKIGFNNHRTSGQNGYNAGMSYNIQSAIDTTENGFEVNWAAVKLSLGVLPNVENLTSTHNGEGNIVVKWNPNNQSGIASPDDMMVFAFYNIEQPLLWISLQTGVTRSMGEFTWTVPTDWRDKIVLGYVFTKQENTDTTSESEFLGPILNGPTCE